jgi:tetratricopeptide (TPR) repeat protein
VKSLVQPNATPEVLAFASQQAASIGDRETDIRARLLLVVALCERGAHRDASALIGRAAADAAAMPTLRLERAMARAAMRHSGALQELETALRLKPDERGWALLAEGLSRLGAWERAEAAYLEAMSTAGSELPSLALRRAENLAVHGRADDALSALQPALKGTQLVRLAALLVTAGLLVDLGRADEALEVAMEAGHIAEDRRNWYALSCAAMDAAAAWRLKGDDARGVSILHSTLTNIRQQGDPGVLLMARLVEIQQEQRARR